MKTPIYSILALLIFISCEKENLKQKQIFNGAYIGTFQRELVWTESDTANITLTFNENQWSGSSDIEKYPALCQGSYSINGDTIIFKNECNWTAEFDWSFILSGKYILIKTEETIEFSRDYRSATTDTHMDKYILRKQE